MAATPLTLAAAALLAAALVAVFCLARQGVEGTRRLAWRTEQLLMRLIPPTGTGAVGEPTWRGLTIRRLAHIGEFALVGVAASLAMLSWRGCTLRAVGLALVICLAAAVADELHKIWVPGRHFDPADVLLDIAGFAPAALLVFGIACLVG